MERVEHKADLLENVDVEVSAEAAGVVVENGLGISETFQNGKHFHGLEWLKRMTAEVGAANTLPALKKKSLYITEYCEYLSEMVISAFVQGAEVVNY